MVDLLSQVGLLLLPALSLLNYTDYGIGMSPEELTANLGTLAKSGTTEFLSKAESIDTTGQGNLIGSFGKYLIKTTIIPPKVCA